VKEIGIFASVFASGLCCLSGKDGLLPKQEAFHGLPGLSPRPL